MTQNDDRFSPATATPPGYDLLTQSVHWLSLGVIAAAFVFGLLMEDVPRGPEKTLLVNLHASLGMLVVVLTVFRLSWRSIVPTPKAVGSPSLQIAAKAMHVALYAAVLAVPLCGLLMMAAKGRAFDVFGLFTVPPLIATDRALGATLEEAHEILAYLLLVLVGLHAAAAIFHQAILKDGTLSRMLPFVRAGNAQAGYSAHSRASGNLAT